MSEPIDLSKLSAEQTIADLSCEILRRAGKPMHYREITRILLQVKPLESKTPEASVYSRMLTDVKDRFVKLGEGVFALQDMEPSKPSPPASSEEQDERQVRIPLFPLYSEMALLLPILDGQPQAHLQGLLRQLSQLRGTPQEPRDWTVPDEWIPQRLSGADQALALAIWRGSKGVVNPRHIRGHWYLARGYELLLQDREGLLRLSELGQDLIQDPDGETVQLIDHQEGLVKLLSIVAERGPGRAGDDHYHQRLFQGHPRGCF